MQLHVDDMQKLEVVLAITSDCVYSYIMVTRINKSSKSRKGTEYLLLWRTSQELGSQGWKVIERAINGDVKAIERIEKLAYVPRRRPALVAWIKRLKAKLKKIERIKQDI